MKELVILSGKGGTGKTTLTAALASLAENLVLADCDVDAADLHLILAPEIEQRHDFYSGHHAWIDSALCSGCDKCYQACRFNAIHKEDEKYRVDPVACEGCGVCVAICRDKAVEFPESLCGEWYQSATRFGPMLHASLGIGAENSGKLVGLVRKKAKELATRIDAEWLLVDGSPGIGCPVIASITGADHLLLITEPTLSGAHDLERVLQLAHHFQIQASVCVNKWDLNPAQTELIEKLALRYQANPVGRISYDASVTQAQLKAQNVIEAGSTQLVNEIRNIWNNLQQHILQPIKEAP